MHTWGNNREHRFQWEVRLDGQPCAAICADLELGYVVVFEDGQYAVKTGEVTLVETERYQECRRRQAERQARYPEHAKLSQIGRETQAIVMFLENLPDGLVLGEWWGEGLHACTKSIPSIIAAYFGIDEAKLEAYFGIDEAKLEQERRAMQEECRR